ncbi:MAG: hypothetical protein RL291_1947 [Pseudomonadota bacterium]|jgi:phosphoglycolate phosphatase
MNLDGIRALLFDKDGTIIDFAKTWTPINREIALFAASGDQSLANELLSMAGHDPATDSVTPGSPIAGAGLDELVDLMAQYLGPKRTPPNLMQNVVDISARGCVTHSTLLPDARKTLLELSARGYILGLATNDTTAGIDASLRNHDVLNLFAFTCAADSGHGAKPGPGMVQVFSAKVGVPLAHVAVIGDSIHDLHMAKNASAGCAIAVLSGTSGHDDLAPHANLVLHSIADLPDILPKRAP